MPRSFWTGQLSFGLVEIPVRLQGAVEPDELDFTMLDKTDLSPIGFRRVNKTTGREVPWERIVKGYDLGNERFVVLGPGDFEKANVEATRTIEIVAFVDGSEIEPLYFETPFYVEPVKKTSRSYVLLRESLRRSGKIGIAKVVLRTRQHLAALLTSGPALVLNLLRFSHEVRSKESLALPAATSRTSKVSAEEMRMADRLIEEMTRAWKPSQYKDEYRDDLLALIRKKARSKGARHIEEEAPVRRETKRADVVDLMPLLRKSLGTRARKKSSARPAAKARKKTRARTPVRRAKAG